MNRGKQNGNYNLVYWRYVGIMKKIVATSIRVEGFRVCGFRFRLFVYFCYGFSISCSVFRVSGLEFRVWCLGT